MNLLAIETATETVSVALAINGEVLERYRHAPRKHAELLLPWIEQLLAQAGVSFNALDAIAFSRGPGSFTSLRLGIGVAQGLAWGTDIPVIPVSSLAATAQSIVDTGINTALVALDARMDEVFTGLFRLNNKQIMMPVNNECVCCPEEIQVPGGPDIYGVGIGFERYAILRTMSAQLAGILPDIWPRASSVLTLAEDWLLTHEALPAEKALPIYLRDNVARKTRDR